MCGPVTAPWVVSPHRQTDEQALCQKQGHANAEYRDELLLWQGSLEPLQVSCHLG